MTFPDDWWTTGMEDEPCDGCGAKPSKHQGHGSFTCKTCYDARWCPKCTYSLDTRSGPHVCKSPEEIALINARCERDLRALDDPHAVIDDLEAENAQLRADLAESWRWIEYARDRVVATQDRDEWKEAWWRQREATGVAASWGWRDLEAFKRRVLASADGGTLFGLIWRIREALR